MEPIETTRIFLGSYPFSSVATINACMAGDFAKLSPEM